MGSNNLKYSYMTGLRAEQTERERERERCTQLQRQQHKRRRFYESFACRSGPVRSATARTWSGADKQRCGISVEHPAVVACVHVGRGGGGGGGTSLTRSGTDRQTDTDKRGGPRTDRSSVLLECRCPSPPPPPRFRTHPWDATSPCTTSHAGPLPSVGRPGRRTPRL